MGLPGGAAGGVGIEPLPVRVGERAVGLVGEVEVELDDILQAGAGLTSVGDDANVNCDGGIDSRDAAIILQVAAGLIGSIRESC